MNDVLIHYFSGTGNTARVVKTAEEILHNAGYGVKTLAIRKGTKTPEGIFDHHIFAFSTLGFSAPVIVKRYIRKLNDGKGAKTAVIAVFAGHPMQALAQVGRMLERRHYKVFLTGGAVYPNNWIQVSNPSDSGESAEIIAKGDSTVKSFISDFTGNKSEFFKCGTFTSIWSWICAVLFGLMGRRFFGKIFIAGKNCNSCGICIKSCPANVISMKGIIRKKPFWNFSCENCNRCINICPVKAIQVSILKAFLHLTINIALIIAAFKIPPAIHSLFPGFILPVMAQAVDIVIALFLFVIFTWLQFNILDRLFFFLEQLPGLRRIFELTYTGNFHRYSAPGFKPLSKD